MDVRPKRRINLRAGGGNLVVNQRPCYEIGKRDKLYSRSVNFRRQKFVSSVSFFHF